MKRASIDIGSNSILLLVADVMNNKVIEICRESRVTSLGKSLDQNKKFLESSIADSIQAIKEYIFLCSKFQISPEQIIVTATEATRVSQNSSIFINALNNLGIKVHIISGQAEAELTAKGAALGFSQIEGDIFILDIGGASSELIHYAQNKIHHSISLPIGSVRSTDWLLLNSFEDNVAKIFTKHEKDLRLYKDKNLLCVAGTMTSLANIILERTNFIEDDVHGMRITKDSLDAIYLKYGGFSPEQFSQLFSFLGKRSFSIRGGIYFVKSLFDYLGTVEVQVSTYGLRYGSILQGMIRDDQLYLKNS